MASAIQITYLHHSGFAVRTRDTLLVFDDAQRMPVEGDSLANGHITESIARAQRQVIYFVSHRHADHFNESIYAMADAGNVQYVLGYDIPEPHKGHRMREGDRVSIGGVEISAYGSTDEGVSFLVRLDGWTIFHAGDLNLWHWRAESTLKEIEQAERDYMDAAAPLIGQEMDFAFFPVDPRMGEMYDAGALHFLMHAKPRVMIPMHWWGRTDVAIDFARRNRSKYVEIVALTRPGETIRAEKETDGGIMIDI